MPHKDIITEVISRAGSTSELARFLGISPQAVSQWERIPLDRVFAIEQLTGLSREYLRPDIYDVPRPVPKDSITRAVA